MTLNNPSELAVLRAQAQAALQAGDRNVARQAIRQALAIDPNDIETLLLATYATDDKTQQRNILDRAKKTDRKSIAVSRRESELFPLSVPKYTFIPDEPDEPPTPEPSAPQSPVQASVKPTPAPAPKKRVSPHIRALDESPFPFDGYIPTLADGVDLPGRPQRKTPAKLWMVMLAPLVFICSAYGLIQLLPRDTSTAITNATALTQPAVLSTTAISGQTRQAVTPALNGGATLAPTYKPSGKQGFFEAGQVWTGEVIENKRDKYPATLTIIDVLGARFVATMTWPTFNTVTNVTGEFMGRSDPGFDQILAIQPLPAGTKFNALRFTEKSFVQGNNVQLNLPYYAVTLDGKVLQGTWVIPGSEGTFTLTLTQ